MQPCGAVAGGGRLDTGGAARRFAGAGAPAPAAATAEAAARRLAAQGAPQPIVVVGCAATTAVTESCQREAISGATMRIGRIQTMQSLEKLVGWVEALYEVVSDANVTDDVMPCYPN